MLLTHLCDAKPQTRPILGKRTACKQSVICFCYLKSQSLYGMLRSIASLSPLESITACFKSEYTGQAHKSQVRSETCLDCLEQPHHLQQVKVFVSPYLAVRILRSEIKSNLHFETLASWLVSWLYNYCFLTNLHYCS